MYINIYVLGQQNRSFITKRQKEQDTTEETKSKETTNSKKKSTVKSLFDYALIGFIIYFGYQFLKDSPFAKFGKFLFSESC